MPLSRGCLLLLCLPQCAAHGGEYTRLSETARDMGWLRFSSLLCLPRKGNFELDGKFQQNLIGGHRHVCLFPVTLSLHLSQHRDPGSLKQKNLVQVFFSGVIRLFPLRD